MYRKVWYEGTPIDDLRIIFEEALSYVIIQLIRVVATDVKVTGPYKAGFLAFREVDHFKRVIDYSKYKTSDRCSTSHCDRRWSSPPTWIRWGHTERIKVYRRTTYLLPEERSNTWCCSPDVNAISLLKGTSRVLLLLLISSVSESVV